MINHTPKFLHLACKIHVLYELLRSRLVDAAQYEDLEKTYTNQKVFFPDHNTPSFWDDTFSNICTIHPMAEAREKIVIKSIIQNKNVLNIGVGRGNLERKLFKKYGKKLKYFGTDFTPNTIRNLKRNFVDWNFILSNPFNLPFKDKSFEQVLLLEVLEHIQPNKSRYLLKEINRICKENATFIISIPINEGLIELLPTNPNSHMRIYTEQILNYELQRAGFTINKIHRITAFNRFFGLKSFINKLFKIRKTNNLIAICQLNSTNV